MGSLSVAVADVFGVDDVVDVIGTDDADESDSGMLLVALAV